MTAGELRAPFPYFGGKRRAAYTAQRTAPDPACTCGHPWHDGPCEHTRDGQPDDGWTPLCPCRRAEPEHDQ